MVRDAIFRFILLRLSWDWTAAFYLYAKQSTYRLQSSQQRKDSKGGKYEIMMSYQEDEMESLHHVKESIRKIFIFSPSQMIDKQRFVRAQYEKCSP